MKSKHVPILIFLIVMSLFSSVNGTFCQGLNAVNDTVEITPGIQVTVNLLANDTLPPGDSITVTCNAPSGFTIVSHSGGNFTFLDNRWGLGSTATANYTDRDVTNIQISNAKVFFIIQDFSFDSLTVNNVCARFDAWGANFNWSGTWPGFKVPKGTQHSTIFLCTPWIGGLDAGNQHHVAAQRYGQGPTITTPNSCFDFFAGPVMDSVNYSSQDTVWNYVWNLKKSDIEYHKAHWHDAGYVPIHDILTWPGNGNPALGEMAKLAPYYDNDGDSTYNPMHGDYPLIMGDQSLYFIFNDDKATHTESTGKKLGVEFHAMAYAFDIPQDSAFKNTVFLNYKIFNRSADTYHNTWFGTFTDFDIGYAQDDYIGCDVQRNSFFGYNADSVDGDGTGTSYGAHPPAQGVTFLSGPWKDADDIDNPKNDNQGHQLCNESVTGFHFGDNITDNEQLGFTTFMVTNNNGVPNYMTDPTGANNGWDYYNCMQAIWKDSTHLQYNQGKTNSGPPCNFMYPGASDTLNWGISCQPPNGPEYWTERTAGNAPYDRRGEGSIGPFTFKPGDIEDVTIAFVFARDYTGSDSLPSMSKLGQMIDVIRNAYNTNTLPNGQSFNGTNNLPPNAIPALKIYPNPSNGKMRIVFGKYLNDNVIITVTDMKGDIIYSLARNPHSDILDIDLTNLRSGLYLVKVETSSAALKQKISIIR